MLNFILLAGLLSGFVWSSSASAQTAPVSERTKLADEKSAKQSERSVGTGPQDPESVGQLRNSALTLRCPTIVESEIVVCARPNAEGFRLKPLPEKYKSKMLGKTLDIEVAPGVHVNGLGLKITF